MPPLSRIKRYVGETGRKIGFGNGQLEIEAQEENGTHTLKVSADIADSQSATSLTQVKRLLDSSNTRGWMTTLANAVKTNSEGLAQVSFDHVSGNGFTLSTRDPLALAEALERNPYQHTPETRRGL